MYNPLEKLNLGIRTKLSIFIAFFIIVIISIVSFVYLRQQYSSLTESFDREIRPLRNYTEKIVLDFQNYSESIIMIEEFRMRLKSKAKELKQFKRQHVEVEERSWFKKSVVGKLNVIKKDLVDTSDIVKVSYSDTFFSSYLTEKKINEIEKQIRTMMRDNKGREISAEKFKVLQGYARNIALNKETINTLRSRAAEKTAPEQKNDQDTGQSNNTDESNTDTADQQKLIAEKEQELNQWVNRLNSEVLNFFYDTQKEKIKEFGLNLDGIRIQSFNTVDSPASFDTKIFANATTMNSDSFLKSPEIKEEWDKQIKNISLTSMITPDARPEGLTIDGREYDIFFRPILKKPSVYKRSVLILEKIKKQLKNDQYRKLIAEDEKLSGEFSVLTELIRTRVKTLKEKKTKPSADNEFKTLYSNYINLIKKREELFTPLREKANSSTVSLKNRETEFIQKTEQIKNKIAELTEQSEKEQDAAKKEASEKQLAQLNDELFETNRILSSVRQDIENWANSPEIMLLDAYENIRDASLYEYAILRFSNAAGTYSEYISSKESREIMLMKYKALREWIFSATSETDIPKISYNGQMIDVMAPGILWRSRSEIEEEMWQLDSMPLYSIDKEGNPGLAKDLFTKSITGFTRTIVDKTEGHEKINSDMKRILYLAGFIGIIATALTFVFSNFMVRNIRILNERAIEVGKGSLNVTFDVKSTDEIGQLSNTLNQMVKGLIERDKVKSAFGKFVHPEIAEMILKKELALGGERTSCAILFSDIRGFTSISEKLDPEGVVEFLNEYMTKMVECVNSTHGIVDKFIGDAIMATWGAGFSRGNNSELSVNSALLMRKALIEFNKGRGSVSKPIINIGCGINYGPVIAGQIGSVERLEYTVIGDAVNLASRVETLNKPFGTDILITQDLYDQVPGIFRVEKMQAITVKGKEKPQTIYAVLGRLDDPSSPKTLKELRDMLGIKFDDSKAVDPDKKEEKFKVIES